MNIWVQVSLYEAKMAHWHEGDSVFLLFPQMTGYTSGYLLTEVFVLKKKNVDRKCPSFVLGHRISKQTHLNGITFPRDFLEEMNTNWWQTLPGIPNIFVEPRCHIHWIVLVIYSRLRETSWTAVRSEFLTAWVLHLYFISLIASRKMCLINKLSAWRCLSACPHMWRNGYRCLIFSCCIFALSYSDVQVEDWNKTHEQRNGRLMLH